MTILKLLLSVPCDLMDCWNAMSGPPGLSPLMKKCGHLGEVYRPWSQSWDHHRQINWVKNNQPLLILRQGLPVQPWLAFLCLRLTEISLPLPLQCWDYWCAHAQPSSHWVNNQLKDSGQSDLLPLQSLNFCTDSISWPHIMKKQDENRRENSEIFFSGCTAYKDGISLARTKWRI